MEIHEKIAGSLPRGEEPRGLARVLSRVFDRLYDLTARRCCPAIDRVTFRYAACGGITLGVNAVGYALIYHFLVSKRFIDLGWAIGLEAEKIVVSPHVASLALVFPLTFFTGYWLNSRVAFVRARRKQTLLKYLLSVGGSIVLSYLCLKGLVECIGLWPTPSNVVASLVTTVYSYAAARFFIWRAPKSV